MRDNYNPILKTFIAVLERYTSQTITKDKAKTNNIKPTLIPKNSRCEACNAVVDADDGYSLTKVTPTEVKTTVYCCKGCLSDNEY